VLTAESLEFFEQFEYQRDASGIDAEIAFQPQCDPRPAQLRAADAPMSAIHFDNADDAFLHPLDDTPFVTANMRVRSFTLRADLSSKISPVK